MDNAFWARIKQAKVAIQKADYIVLGGGAGLSAATGLEYSGIRFTENFTPFIKKYGLTDMYSSGFYPFKTQEEKWAYWAKHISLNRYKTGPTTLYKDLFTLVKDKNYFVITTNVDSQFEKAGFPSHKVFEIQGNYGYIQCTKGCHNKLYNNELLVEEMVEKTIDCKIPSELVPKCPVCHGDMYPNIRVNKDFVQDEKWYELNKSYSEFLKDADGKNVVYMELGVGYNTPGIIRYPFESSTYHNKNATLIRFNKDNPDGVEENKDKTIAFTENMLKVIEAMME